MLGASTGGSAWLDGQLRAGTEGCGGGGRMGMLEGGDAVGAGEGLSGLSASARSMSVPWWPQQWFPGEGQQEGLETWGHSLGGEGHASASQTWGEPKGAWAGKWTIGTFRVRHLPVGLSFHHGLVGVDDAG